MRNNEHKDVGTTRKMIEIVIDNREHDLYEALQPYASDTTKLLFEVLDVGDIHFRTVDPSGVTLRVCLERKTAADLGASQVDGRYREQRARLLSLRGTGVKIGYIVETPAWSPTLGRSWCLGKFNEVHLQTAMARLQLRYDIPVFHAMSIKETVMWIRRFTASLHLDPEVFTGGAPSTAVAASKVYSDAIHVKKAANTSAESIFTSMLLTVPGLGPQAATAIGAAVGHSIPTLITKSADEIAAIPMGKKKVGAVLAARLFDIFHITPTGPPP